LVLATWLPSREAGSWILLYRKRDKERILNKFVRLPPGTGHVLVPTSSRRAAAAGIALLTFCHKGPLAGQWALYTAVRLCGGKLIPGPRVSWALPDSLINAAAMFGNIDAVAVYERPQASRSGFSAVLMGAGRAVAFVKARPESAGLDRERRVLQAFPNGDGGHFRVPLVLSNGSDWLLLEALPIQPTRPWRRPPIKAIEEEIDLRLRHVLPRADNVPGHWKPMHGDLTPWNVRRVANRGWIIDWEDAAWAPPGADRAYLAATSSAVFGSRPIGANSEVIDFWLDRLARRTQTDHDSPFNNRIARALRSMRLAGRQ
jgi:Phosphotransferase enzyme family